MNITPTGVDTNQSKPARSTCAEGATQVPSPSWA